ncbi:MAG: chitobiase/beta-hexosaminidase C-terminal domain-containing protein [Patescibacteria group bacterium]|nr:chitobiase/beta-hexosaminidase C-terminal domain-containing protein [Patescibacteria group bacterium]
MKITAIIACCLLLFQSFSPVAFVFLNESLAVGDDLSSDETASASAVPNVSDDEKNGEILPADSGGEILIQSSAEPAGPEGNQSNSIEQKYLEVAPVNDNDIKEAVESSASAAPVSETTLSPQDLPAPPPQPTNESVSPSSSSPSNQFPVSPPPSTQPTLASDNPSPTVLSSSTNNISNNIQPRLDAAISSPSPIAVQTSKVLSLLSPESGSIGSSAKVSTDKADYSPTDVAVISGSGLNAGQTYILVISSNDSPAVNVETSVAADNSGNFVYNYQLDGNFRPNYKVELKDSSGQVLATTAFTDASNKVGSVVVGSQTGTLTFGTASSVTFNVTVNRGSSGTFDAALSLTTGLPTGALSSFLPGSLHFASSDSTHTSTLTITTTSSTPAGSTSFTAKALYSVSDYATGNGTLTVNAPADTTAPTGGSITYTDGYYTSASVALTVNDGTDAGSGINTASRIMQRKSAALAAGTCGSFGSFSTIAPSGSYPNFTDNSVISGNCYQYQYQVSDNAPTPNQATYTSSNVAKIDTVAPTTPVLTSPADGAITNDTSPTLTLSASTDAASGISEYRYQVEDSSGFLSPQKNYYTSNTYYTPDLSTYSDRTWYWHVMVRDNGGNWSGWSSPFSFTVDTTVPVITINNPNTNPAQSKTVTASTNEGTLTQSVTLGSACDASLTFSAYADTVFTGEADNGKKVCYRAVDATGNTAYSLSAAIAGIDTTAPSTADSGTDSNWHNSDVTVTLTCNDGTGSGCSNTYYTTDGTDPTTSSSTGTSIALTADGTYTIKYFSKDNAGNSESIKTVANQVKIDKTNPSAPGTPSTTTPTNSTSQAWNWDAATDALSGVLQYLWRTDAPTSGSVSGVSKTTGLSEGLWNFFVKAEDSAGNFSGESKGSVLVDTTAPATPTASPAGGDYTSAQKVNLSSSDANAYEIYFTTDGSTPTSGSGKYTGTITISGDTTLKAVAVDGAGNQSSVMTQSYGIAPSISGETAGAVTQSSVTINWTTDLPGTSRVIYDSSPHSTLGAAPNYGYAHSTAESDTSPKVTAHSVALNDLTAGVTYYYRTVSKGSPESLSDERSFATTFGTVLGASAVAEETITAIEAVVGQSAFAGGEALAAEPSAKVAEEPQVLGQATPEAAPASQPTAETNQNAAAESSWGTWVLFALLVAFVLLIFRTLFFSKR